MAADVSTYSHSAALPYLYLAAASYCSPASIEQWRCAPCKNASAALGADVKVRTVFEGDNSRLRGFVASAPGMVIVSFRGSVEWRNFYIDFEDYRTASYDRCDSCLVHLGFLTAWQDVNASVTHAVQAAQAADPRARLVLIGHSLGGAVTSLAALDMSLTHNIRPSAVYTFGEPRLGNDVFAAFYRNCTSGWPTWRVTHAADIVPHLPPRNMLVPYILTYEHHVREVWYGEDSHPERFQVCSGTNGEDFDCADSKWVYELSVTDHLHYLGRDVGLAACANDTHVLAAPTPRTPKSGAGTYMRAALRTVGGQLADGLGLVTDHVTHHDGSYHE